MEVEPTSALFRVVSAAEAEDAINASLETRPVLQPRLSKNEA